MWRGGTTDSPFVPLSVWRRCHPERARGTRASEGPACGRIAHERNARAKDLLFIRPRNAGRPRLRRRKAGPSHLRASRSFAPAALRMTGPLAFVSPHPLSPSPQMWRGGTTDSPFVPPLRMAERGTGGEDRRSRSVVILSERAGRA